MLLAASVKNEDGSELVEVLFAEDAEPGTDVLLEGLDTSFNGEEIDIDTFFQLPILAKEGTIYVDKHRLLVKGQALASKRVLNGEVG